MDTSSLRQSLGYFSGGDTFFRSLLQEAENCYPDGDPITIAIARALMTILNEARGEATGELIKLFDQPRFGARELMCWVQRITAASRAIGLLEGRFALNTPRD